MPLKNRTLAQSFACAFSGLAFAVQTQRNMRLHFVAAILVLVVSVSLGVSAVETAVLLGMVGFVITAEMVNTALETMIDLVSPGFHELAGRAKNLAAGAVVVAALFAAAVGLLILGPPLLRVILAVR